MSSCLQQLSGLQQHVIVAWCNVCPTHLIKVNRLALWIRPVVTDIQSSYLVNIGADIPILDRCFLIWKGPDAQKHACVRYLHLVWRFSLVCGMTESVDTHTVMSQHWCCCAEEIKAMDVFMTHLFNRLSHTLLFSASPVKDPPTTFSAFLKFFVFSQLTGRRASPCSLSPSAALSRPVCLSIVLAYRKHFSHTYLQCWLIYLALLHICLHTSCPLHLSLFLSLLLA